MFLLGNIYFYIMDQQYSSSSYNDVHSVLSYFPSINDSIHSVQLDSRPFLLFCYYNVVAIDDEQHRRAAYFHVVLDSCMVTIARLINY